MCFSTEVSFTLAGALAVAGAYCVRRCVALDRTLLPIAATPLIFGVQQFCEGWVWTGIMRSNPTLTQAAAVFYLFFALFFWPIWVPLSTFHVERVGRTRAFLIGMTLAGLTLGVVMMIPVLTQTHLLSIIVQGHSIHYSMDRSAVFGFFPPLMWQAMYLLIVATPLFVSSREKFAQFGLALILAAAATHVFFDHAFASVWCFFAALLSLYLCWFFHRLKPEPMPAD